MDTTLSSILALVIGSVMVVNGISTHTDKILSDAKRVANNANLHQLATVVEIYYLDNNKYPNANNGEELVDILEKGAYIMNRPLNPSEFQYQSKSDGQDYSLRLVD
jgi:hypothetical protein